MNDGELIKALCDIEAGLSNWEVEFVESLCVWLEDEGRPLTAKQRDKAIEILEAHE